MHGESPSANGFESTAQLAFDALAQSGCGALVTDKEGTILYVNPRLCKISGYESHELVGKNPRVLQSGSTPPETYHSLWNTITSGKPWHGVMQNRKKCGDCYWEAVTISPIKTVDGKITHYSAILEDITEDKFAATAQTEVEREIVQQEKLECLATMTRGMSHDLNNSLGCILAACELAISCQNDPKTLVEMLGLIKSSASSSVEFVGQMANLWKPSDPLELPTDLVVHVREHLQLYQKAAGRHPLHWKPEIESAPITGDPAKIHQAILALIENARESAPDRPIELRCGSSARLEPEADEYFLSCGLTGLSVVYLEVIDAGGGMDSQTLRRAFNPYFSTKRGQKGLGLALVHGIMTGHRGAIGVRTSPGRGTRIRLYFRNCPAR